MRALTIRQPWAWAVAFAGKDVENRTRPHPWRSALGEQVVVHAASQPSLDFDDDLLDIACLADPDAEWDFEQKELLDIRGACLALTTIVGVHQCDGRCSVWAQPDQWHLELADTRLVRPVLAKGALGLWLWPPYLPIIPSE